MAKNTPNRIIELTKEMITQKGFQQKHVVDAEKNFRRQRKLGFDDTVLYVLGNTRQTSDLSIESYCESKREESISGAAICKARAKIKYTAFEELFEETAKQMPVKRKYQGYQVIAVDGMRGELPKEPELLEKYRVSKKTLYPQFHAVSAYDVLNEVFIAADFLPAPANEYKAAIELLKHGSLSASDQILVFDRGFPCIALIQKLNEMDKKYVMRVSKSFLKEVNDFSKGTRMEQQLHICYDRRRGAVNKVKAALPYEFDLRCVRIHLIDGSDEICITNLPRETFPKRTIKELYKLRWGIESSFNNLKHAVFVEEFSSKKDNGIKQDFYASLWAANLISAMIEEGVALSKKKRGKKN